MPYVYATFERTTTGNVLTSISGSAIVVVNYCVGAGLATFFNFQDEDGVVLMGRVPLGTSVPYTFVGGRDSAAFEVPRNKSLAIRTSVATTIGGHFAYYTV